MKLPRFVAAVIVAASMVSLGNAAEPSTGCGTGQVPPGTTPAGVGVSATAPPGTPPSGTGSVKACNTGAVVPEPLKGAVTVSGSTTSNSGYVDVDGDSSNVTGNCTDGFVRVAITSGGPVFYESKDGNFTDTKPNQSGNQTAQPETADQFATNTSANCHP